MANVSKLKIVSYSSPDRKDKGESWDVQINPETYSQKIAIKYSDKQAPGTSGKQMKFAKMEPQKMDFELMFDRTGVVNGMVAGEFGVDEDISKLKSLTLEYQGDKHRPKFLTIYWGTLKFDCCLEAMDISYKLFNMQGLPLRAVVKSSFIGSIEENKRVAKENSSSPDLMHVRVVNQGDTLPLMCNDIYNDPKYYIEVAAFNNLEDFRYLETGQKIFFPAIEK